MTAGIQPRGNIVIVYQTTKFFLRLFCRWSYFSCVLKSEPQVYASVKAAKEIKRYNYYKGFVFQTLPLLDALVFKLTSHVFTIFHGLVYILVFEIITRE